MRQLRSAVILLAVCFFAAAASAATFIVPSDRELVHQAKAIVIATAQGSFVVGTPRGMVYTVYELRVEQVIKGAVRLDQRLQLKEDGGAIDGWAVGVPDSPRYEAGERALLFLEQRPDGDWRTWGMPLGKFNFVHDLHGTRLLMRGQDEGAIFGWDAAGNRYREVYRSEEKFLKFVRDEACGAAATADYAIDPALLEWPKRIKAAMNGAGFHACDYMESGGTGTCGFRWQTIFDQPGGGGSVTWRINGTQTGVADSNGGIDSAMGAWNSDLLSNVNYGRGGATTAGCSVCDNNADGENVIILNATSGLPSGAVGYTKIGGDSTYTFDGGTMINTVEADILIKQGFTSSQQLFNEVITHELGHSLGMRHSGDRAPATTSAVMNSTSFGNFGANLQQWDRDAVETIYNPSPAGTCTPPRVASATATPSTITSGNSSQLDATGAGTGPFTFQWYVGSPGNTSTPAGPAGATITVSPTTTSAYWVRVTGHCAPPADSSAVTVTVTPCTPPSNVVASANPTSVTAGNSSNLSASASGSTPITFQWFTGNPPNGTNTGQTGASIFVTPASTTTYFARATSSCGSADSNAITVTVTGCVNAQITQQPFANPSTITAGNFTNLTVGASGTGPTYQWYEGTSPNTAKPINGATNFSLPANPSQTTSYWVRVTGQCGPPVDSNTVTVTVVAACVPPSSAAATASPLAVNAGQSSTLTATANGTGLSFQWFTGTPPNGTAIPNATTPSFLVKPATTTTYFARITGQCGPPSQLDTNAVTVTVTLDCVGPVITAQPANKTILFGEKATLSVSVTLTTPVTFQWFRGATGDTTNPQPGATGPTFTTPNLTAKTQYWVRVTGLCGQPVSSNTATVELTTPKHRAAKH